jgi:hypothetical protein
VRIVINHLTRMRAPHVCVAGIDVETQRHVRPVLPGVQQLTTALLRTHGGPFDIAVEVELGRTSKVATPPEVEDHIFEPARAKALRTFLDHDFWSLLEAVSAQRLLEIFGNDLTPIGATSCGVNVGYGVASLGCLIPANRPRLRLRARQAKPAQIRIVVTDGEFHLDLSVTDVRLYQPDLATPVEPVVRDIDRRMRRGVPVVLSVGLTRPFATSPEHAPVHWLQVNNIHLEDQPVWSRGASMGD